MGVCHGLEVSFRFHIFHPGRTNNLSYALQWLIVLPLEIIAASITVGYWNSNLSRSIFVTIFLSTIVIINLFGVKAYGEAEFLFAIIKITAVIGFM
jgi:amino acid transporter